MSDEDRYPNRAKAITAARALEMSEDAIRIVSGVALRSDVDPSPREWLDEIEHFERQVAGGDPPMLPMTQSDADELARLEEAGKAQIGKPKTELQDHFRSELESVQRLLATPEVVAEMKARTTPTALWKTPPVIAALVLATGGVVVAIINRPAPKTEAQPLRSFDLGGSRWLDRTAPNDVGYTEALTFCSEQTGGMGRLPTIDELSSVKVGLRYFPESLRRANPGGFWSISPAPAGAHVLTLNMVGQDAVQIEPRDPTERLYPLCILPR